MKCGLATAALQNAFYSSNNEKRWQYKRESRFHPQGHWYWSEFWLWMSLKIDHCNNLPLPAVSSSSEQIMVGFTTWQKVGRVCPGEVLRSQLRVGAEPHIVLFASSHYCHRANCAAFGFVLLLRSTLICFGCDRDGQLPCLLSASSNSVRKNH